MSNRNNDPEEVLSGFNPFDQKEFAKPTPSTSTPRPIFTTAILPEPPRVNTNQNDNVFHEIKERERALKDLENQIQKREDDLRNKEGDLKGVKINNFPPLPKCLPCKPCFYQDFDVDISEEYRYIVKLGFYIWISYSILLFLNLFGTLSYFIVGFAEGGPMFGVALMMFLIMPPLGYILWFRPLYRAFRSQSSLNFFMFFLFFAVLIILVIIQALGINVLGSCGWINSSVTVSKNVGIGVFMFVISLGFTVIVASSIFLYIKVHRTYRNTGASFDKAKAEMRNETVSAALHA